jgi:MHS family proline/betaine transporter-like MFS transporter
VLLGSGTAALFAAFMPTDMLNDWGWRVPFLLGLGLGIAGYFLRRHIADTEAPPQSEGLPIVETLRDHRGLVGRFAALAVFDAVAFYVLFVYVVSWLQTADGISPAHALEINTLSVAVVVLAKIVGGHLTDFYGRRSVPLVATALGFIGAVPFFWLMYHANIAYAMVGQLYFAVIIGLFIGSEPVLMVEAAPARIRCTATSVGYNLSIGIAGGLSPLVATWLVARTDDQLSPAFLVMAAAAISFLAVLRFRETLPRSATAPIRLEA